MRPRIQQVKQKLTELPEVHTDEQKMMAARARQVERNLRLAEEAERLRQEKKRQEKLEDKATKKPLRRQFGDDDAGPRSNLAPSLLGRGDGGARPRFRRPPARRGG
ncbi:hypothetical protein PTSG_10397 [Salpingoeca rosetta]|uniref:Uncharacterized protein n=1 Tax=Salpingoeca rosetta (strain ATCC 50818 / BSB-021) TaxID=946362 RepID=F2UR68_SALR5|nr:uncharacterized protein PTSG_10397 [Salpingoeca rosetta]EGD80123.1 hypothetical protein PTSG_10397 [Salpingoeca rosetta]|eukprot:XP_004988448.1 hypothetical protein PTSG_10397 [Salpingoeca rosetta]